MEKLVRDNIIDIKIHEWENPVYRTCKSIDEKIRFLLFKSVEEYQEYVQSQTIDAKIEEAADVLEVYDTIISIAKSEWHHVLAQTYQHEKRVFLQDLENLHILYSEILVIQESKRRKKWGFEKGIVLTL